MLRKIGVTAAVVAVAASTAACGSPDPASIPASDSSNCTITPVLDQVKGMDAVARTQKLTELAAKESKNIQIYSTLSDEEMAAVASEFKNRTGVTIKVYDATSEQVLQRLGQETQAGKTQADLVENNGTELQLAAQDNLLAPFTTPYSADLPKDAVFPTWVGHQYNVFTVLRNPTVVPDGDAPAKYADLADPKFKGKLGVEAGNWDLFEAIVKDQESQGMTEDQAVDMWKKIVANSRVYDGNTQLADALEQGQLGLAITYNHYYSRYLAKGSKTIAWQAAIQPQVVRANGSGIPCKAPDPATAVLLLDFLVSPDGQAVLGKVGNRDVTNPNVKTGLLPGSNLRKISIDLSSAVKDSKEWTPKYDSIIKSGGK